MTEACRGPADGDADAAASAVAAADDIAFGSIS